VKGSTDMGLLDAIVSQAFRNEKAGRVVVFSGDRHHRGYIVKSVAEERKIRSFLKMFYAAHFSILLLGLLVADAWATFVIHVHAFGRPAQHFVKVCGIFLGIYSLVVGVPSFLLWRSYRKELLTFVSTQDEVSVSGERSRRQLQQTLIRLGLLTVALGLLVAIVWLIRPK